MERSTAIGRALHEGPPTNAEIDRALDNTKHVLESEGRGTVIRNLENVIEDTKQLIHEKNADQKFQRFIVLCKQLSEQAALEASSSYGTEKERMWGMQKRASDVAANLQSATFQIVSSSEFRSLLLDFLSLLRDAAKEEIQSHDTGISWKVTEAKETAKQATTAVTSSTTAALSPTSAATTVTTPSGRTLGEAATETKEQLKEFVGGIASDIRQGSFNVSDNTKRALDARFREILSRIGNNADFRRATLALLDMFEELKNVMWEAKEKGEQHVMTQYDVILKNLRKEGFNIVTEFTGKAPLEKWNRDFWNFLEKIRNDPELSQFFNDINAYIRDILQQPDRLQQQLYIDRSLALVNRGSGVWERFRDKKEADILLGDTQNLLYIIQNDPAIRKLSEDSRILAQQAFYDSRGVPSLEITRETLNNLKHVLLPLIMENIKNVPIGRIEGYEHDYWFSLDDVAFSPQDVMPENVYIKFETDVSIDLKHLETKEAPAYLLRIELRNINSHFRNVHFRFKKTSFPHMEDNGIADVDIQGITLVLRWFSAPSYLASAWVFGLKRAKCHIYDVNINIKAAHHDVLLPMFTKFYERTVRRRLEALLESTMTTQMENVSNQLNQILNKQLRSFGTTSESRSLLSTAGSKIQEAIENAATNLSQMSLGPK